MDKFQGGGPPSREKLRQYLRDMFPSMDFHGVELFSLIHMIGHLSEALENQGSESEISGPRWRLLLRLFIAEHQGDTCGITPTDLSETQRVSKNTISALLRGLEEQGLIERSLDPKDYRAFRIRLTEAGRDFIKDGTPRRIAHMNKMADALTPDECQQLIVLLEKLSQPLLEKAFNKEKVN